MKSPLLNHILDTTRDHVILCVYKLLLDIRRTKLPWHAHHVWFIFLKYWLVLLSDLPLEDCTLLFLDDTRLLIVHFYFVKLVCKKANLADRSSFFGLVIKVFQYVAEIEVLVASRAKLRQCVDFWRFASLMTSGVVKRVIGLDFTDTGSAESGPPLIDHHRSSLGNFTTANGVSRGHRR